MKKIEEGTTIYDALNGREIIIVAIDTRSNQVTCKVSEYVYDEETGEADTTDEDIALFTVPEIRDMIRREA